MTNSKDKPIIEDEETERFFKELDNLTAPKDRLTREEVERFYKLAVEWIRGTASCSSTIEMAKHPAYLKIESMGTRVVPLLLRELELRPAFWFAALRHLTGADPVKPEQRGNLKQMADAWLEWGKDQGINFPK